MHLEINLVKNEFIGNKIYRNATTFSELRASV